MMNNTTLDVDRRNFQEMKALQQLLKQIKGYNDKIETVWTYAPLIIMAFGLTGKFHEQQKEVGFERIWSV